ERIMSRIFQKARLKPKRIVFPEGDEPRIMKAAIQSVDEGIAKPILLGNEERIRATASELNYDLEGIEIINPKNSPKLVKYIDEYFNLRNRKGITMQSARKTLLRMPNYFGAMMVHLGDADGMISGLTSHYPDTIRPALSIIGRDSKYQKVSGLYILSTKKDTYFLSDTTVNVDPSPETLADITLQAADFATNFDIKPRVAMLSYSNFGSANGESPEKVIKAIEIIRQRKPDLIIDGEMQADTAVVPDIVNDTYPFCSVKGDANILIFPDLNSGNISYKLLNRIGGAHAIGPVLLGLSKAVHVLQRGAEVHEILNMIGIAAVDCIHKEELNK
ncbi:MAG: hypothetical protein QG635_1643, partial [Bacteroidota bacterium]|nr:hypothetical protein [Bacteroidota bacterium]